MQKFHQYLGLFMLLPFIAWAVTGVFFFFKPGYKEAYQPLVVKQYPIDSLISLPVQQAWLEVRQLKTILGHHLLVKTEEGWQQLSLDSLEQIAEPSKLQITQLINDAISQNKTRYGDIDTIDELKITTSEEVRIQLNWQTMSLRQKGADTDFINTIYNIHYLRWTGIKMLDQFLGVIGLILVVVLAGIGTVMTFRRNPSI